MWLSFTAKLSNQVTLLENETVKQTVTADGNSGVSIPVRINQCPVPGFIVPDRRGDFVKPPINRIVFVVVVIFGPVWALTDEKSLSTVFPAPIVFPKSNFYYCSATLGAYMYAREADVKQVRRGLYANVSHPTDRVIIEISGEKVFLFRKDEFEGGLSRKDAPMEIIHDTETDLVAIDVGDNVKGKVIDVVTLNRKTGLGSWSNVRSIDGFTGNPNMQAYYLSCGPREK